MTPRQAPLNRAQLDVLEWVRQGCPDEEYEGWSHRITARALHNRGLLVIKGQGKSWSATLTAEGAYYLEHGKHPPSEASSGADTSRRPESGDRQLVAPRLSRTSAAQQKKPVRKPKRPGPLDQMMTALQDADDHRISVPSAEATRYRQLVGAAKRYGRIPEGMRITVGYGRNGQSTVTLEPLPGWQTRVLEPVPVPNRLREPSDVVQALSQSSTFQVRGEPKIRALRIAEALVGVARERGMEVEAVLRQAAHRGYYGGGVSRRDGIEFRMDAGRFRLWFTQAMLQQPHEPTAREIKRVQYGHLFPDFDEVPDEHLGLVLEGEGGRFWADEWKDTDEHQLEDDLAQILEEIRLRHGHQVVQRKEKQDQFEARQRAYEQDRAQAMVKYRQHFLANAMKTQAASWDEGIRLRRYAEAIRNQAERLEGTEQEQELSWAGEIEAESERIDPLSRPAVRPEIPEPSSTDLEAFMKKGRAYWRR